MESENYRPTEEIKEKGLEQESTPRSVVLNPQDKFPSKVSPIFESQIVDPQSQEVVGNIDFQLLHRTKEIIVQTIVIDRPKQGYGVETYKQLQKMYPDYRLTSSEEMYRKETPDQEKSNAVYLWEKLVKLGLAEGSEESGFRMIK